MAEESYNGRTFTDIAEHLSKVQLKVFVKESYVPVTHYAFLAPGAPPPILQIDNSNMDDICTAWLSPRYIVDALVNGHYVQFAYIKDMEKMKDWLKIYIDELESVNGDKHPETVGVLKDVKRAYEMLQHNLKEYNNWEEEKHPKPISIVDLVSML